MKKTYKTPTMKVRKIHCSHMLCLSGGDTLGITDDEVSESPEGNKYIGREGYDNAW